MASNDSDFNYLDFLRQRGILNFNYLAHLNNLESIMKNGIFSRNYIIKNDIPFFRIDYESVQNQRIRNIMSKYDFHIHDFAPTFFSTHTPMLYRICDSKKNFYGRDKHGEKILVSKLDIAILKIDVKLLSYKGVKFTNKNCACNSVEVYQDVKDLSKLNWNDIQTKEMPYNEFWPYQKILYEQKIYRFNKSAEILTPLNIPSSYIEKILVFDKKYVKDKINGSVFQKPIVENKEEFTWT